MNKEPIIFITKPEKQLIEKDNLEIEINNYDNSHLYYKGFDLGTFKEIANLRQENKQLKDNWEIIRQYCLDEQIPEESNEYNSYIEFSNSVYDNILNKMQELEQGSDE